MADKTAGKGENDKKKEKEKPERKPVTLSTGKVTTDPTVEIKCAEKGCTETRIIKKQDQFQVKYCLKHQKEHRNRLRRERRKKNGSKTKTKQKAKA